jgi:hypothetical protein
MIPGGALGSIYAIILGRYRKFPDINENGVYGIP